MREIAVLNLADEAGKKCGRRAAKRLRDSDLESSAGAELGYFGSMKSVSLGEAKENFAALVEVVETTNEAVRITRSGQPAAVLISMRDWESYQETLRAHSTAKVVSELDQAQIDFEAGITVSGDELRRRYDLDTDAAAQDKPKLP